MKGTVKPEPEKLRVVSLFLSNHHWHGVSKAEIALSCQRDSGEGVQEGAQADKIENKMKHYVPVMKGMSST